MVTNYGEHLHPDVRQHLHLSGEERIAYLEKDNWIGYPHAQKALNKLESLYSHPSRQRMPNLLIIGPTNNGKSMIVEKFSRNHPPMMKSNKGAYFIETRERLILTQLPVLVIQMLPVPDLRKFYRSIYEKLRALGGIDHQLLLAAPQEDDVIYLLGYFKVKLLIIDEIHNVLAGRNDKQHQFLNALRYLGNALKIPIVCVGTKDAYLVIRSDPQLENRFEPFLLPPWKADKSYGSLIASILSLLPLKKPTNVANSTLLADILKKSEGILGEIVVLVRRAAIDAIRTGREQIDEEILKQVDYHSPTERVRLFESSLVGLA